MFFIIAGNSNLELFDSESGPDLTLSPQTFTSTAEAFINDNSDSLGVPGDNDMEVTRGVRRSLLVRDFRDCRLGAERKTSSDSDEVLVVVPGIIDSCSEEQSL
ncbi:hypothetical protein PV326_002973 [Microctonus aethiopoides]|nr:hypothetical protein PV326_002973 [Microctonus aethiopoides]